MPRLVLVGWWVVATTGSCWAAGARVELRREVVPFKYAAELFTVTDESGRFSAELPAGTYQVWLPGRRPDTTRFVTVGSSPSALLRLAADVALALPSAQPAALRPVPLRYGTVVGRVLDARGRPRPGLVVSVGGEGEDADRAIATTDASGRFRCARLPVGEYELWPGWLTELPERALVFHGAPDRETWVEYRPPRLVSGRLSGVPAGWEGGVEFAAPGHTCLGGSDGRPPVLTVITSPDEPRPPSPGRYLRVAPPDKGQTTFGEPEPRECGRERYLTTSLPGQRQAWLLLRGGRRDEDDFVVLDAGRCWVGPDGAALDFVVPRSGANLRVAVHVALAGADPSRPASLLLHAADGRLAAGATLRRDRTVDWRCLPPGDYQLAIDLPGRMGQRQAVRLVGGDNPSASISPCRGVRVTGRLSGGWAEDYVVLHRSDAYGAAQVSADGSFALDGVPPGRYQLWFGNELWHGTRELEVAADPIALELKAGPR